MEDGLPDSVTVTIGSDYLLMADAGSSKYVSTETVILDGTKSHTHEGFPPTKYYWRKISGPSNINIQNPNSPTPSVAGIVRSDSMQILEFELIVSDGVKESLPDTTEIIIVPLFEGSSFMLENETFDLSKPTIIFLGGIDSEIHGNELWGDSDWEQKANIISFEYYIDGWPDSPHPRSYERCGDMIIAYLSDIAPEYNQAIQTIGFGSGGAAAIDVAKYINMTYSDPRYDVNRVTLIHCLNQYTY